MELALLQLVRDDALVGGEGRLDLVEAEWGERHLSLVHRPEDEEHVIDPTEVYRLAIQFSIMNLCHQRRSLGSSQILKKLQPKLPSLPRTHLDALPREPEPYVLLHCQNSGSQATTSLATKDAKKALKPRH